MNYATDDIESIVLKAMPNWRSLLDEKAPLSLRWTLDEIENGGHVPLNSFHDGLRFIFPDWKYPDDQLVSKGLSGVRNHYNNLAGKYNIQVKIPSGLFMDLGMARFRAEEWEKAKEVFIAYASEYPHSGRAQYFLGEIYRKIGNEAKAISCYKKALEIDPAFSPAQRRLDEISQKG